MTKTYKHPPAEEGCGTCHAPHSSDNANLLVMDIEKLCLQCHEKVPKTHLHGMGKTPYVDQKTGQYVNCVSCHDPHSSNNEKMTKGDRRRELCARCHKKGQHEL